MTEITFHFPIVQDETDRDEWEIMFPHIAERGNRHYAIRREAQGFVNLTPHDVVIRLSDCDVRIASSGVARVTEMAGEVEDAARIIQVAQASNYGEITGLPAPADGVTYITSAIVATAAAASGRRDVVAPDTGSTAVRDDEGRIIAVRRLVRR